MCPRESLNCLALGVKREMTDEADDVIVGPQLATRDRKGTDPYTPRSVSKVDNLHFILSSHLRSRPGSNVVGQLRFHA